MMQPLFSINFQDFTMIRDIVVLKRSNQIALLVGKRQETLHSDARLLILNLLTRKFICSRSISNHSAQMDYDGNFLLMYPCYSSSIKQSSKLIVFVLRGPPKQKGRITVKFHVNQAKLYVERNLIIVSGRSYRIEIYHFHSLQKKDTISLKGYDYPRTLELIKSEEKLLICTQGELLLYDLVAMKFLRCIYLEAPEIPRTGLFVSPPFCYSVLPYSEKHKTFVVTGSRAFGLRGIRSEIQFWRFEKGELIRNHSISWENEQGGEENVEEICYDSHTDSLFVSRGSNVLRKITIDQYNYGTGEAIANFEASFSANPCIKCIEHCKRTLYVYPSYGSRKILLMHLK